MVHIFPRAPKPVPADVRPPRSTPKAKPADAYRVCSPEEADPEILGSLQTKRAEMQARQADRQREARRLEKAIAADPSIDVPIKISELLGDEPGQKALNRKAMVEAVADASNAETALRIIEARIAEARPAANRKAAELVRPEFGRRIRKMVDAMKALDAAHAEFDALCQDMDSVDIQYGHLGPKPYWLGDRRDGSGRIANYLKEAEAAGYAN